MKYMNKEDHEFEKAWYAIDENENNVVTEWEFFDNAAEVLELSGDENELEVHFNIYDLNDDGVIEKEEAKKVSSTKHLYGAIDMMYEAWRALDDNGNGSLNFEEFVDVYNLLYSLDFSPKADMDTLVDVFEQLASGVEEKFGEDIHDSIPVHHLYEFVRSSIHQAFDDIEIEH